MDLKPHRGGEAVHRGALRLRFRARHVDHRADIGHHHHAMDGDALLGIDAELHRLGDMAGMGIAPGQAQPAALRQLLAPARLFGAELDHALTPGPG